MDGGGEAYVELVGSNGGAMTQPTLSVVLSSPRRLPKTYRLLRARDAITAIAGNCREQQGGWEVIQPLRV